MNFSFVGNIVIDGKGEERSNTWTITKAKEQRRTSNKTKETDKEQRQQGQQKEASQAVDEAKVGSELKQKQQMKQRQWSCKTQQGPEIIQNKIRRKMRTLIHNKLRRNNISKDRRSGQINSDNHIDRDRNHKTQGKCLYLRCDVMWWYEFAL